MIRWVFIAQTETKFDWNTETKYKSNSRIIILFVSNPYFLYKIKKSALSKFRKKEEF